MKALEAKGTVINTKMKEIYGKYNEAKQKNDAVMQASLEKQLDSLDNAQTAMQKTS